MKEGYIQCLYMDEGQTEVKKLPERVRERTRDAERGGGREIEDRETEKRLIERQIKRDSDE